MPHHQLHQLCSFLLASLSLSLSRLQPFCMSFFLIWNGRSRLINSIFLGRAPSSGGPSSCESTPPSPSSCSPPSPSPLLLSPTISSPTSSSALAIMDRRQILLLLLVELWHLQTMCACTMLVLLLFNVRRKRAERHALNYMSISKEGSRQSQVSQKKRKRNDEDRVMRAFNNLFEESGKRMQMVTDAIMKGNEDRYDIAKELEDMGLSIDDQIKAVEYILEKQQRISVLISLRGEARKRYVDKMLAAAAATTSST